MQTALVTLISAVSLFATQAVQAATTKIQQQWFLWSLNASLKQRCNPYRWALSNQQKLADGYWVAQRFSQGMTGRAMSQWVAERATIQGKEFELYFMLLVTDSVTHLCKHCEEQMIEFLTHQMEGVFSHPENSPLPAAESNQKRAIA